MIRVLGLVPYPLGRVPGQRYRIEQWAPLLPKYGIEMTMAPFLSDRAMDVLYDTGNLRTKIAETVRAYAGSWRRGKGEGRYDLAYVYREAALLAPTWLDTRLVAGLPTVYDFDDAIYIPVASAANRWSVFVKSRHKTMAHCRRARHVTVGNETLAEYARTQAAQVTVVPSTIDTSFYSIAARPANQRPVIGWTGSATTVAHLQLLARPLARLRELVDYELRVIGARPVLPGDHVRFIPWSASKEVEDLRPLDVGLMPLPDDEWSRGKCGMKALQYMALAIPPVVSPVGMNTSLVEDGVNGFHARTEAEWVEKIYLLLSDSTLCHRLGAAARLTVERGYSAAVQAPRMAQVFREAAA